MRSGMLVPIAIASAIGCFPCSELRAEPGYKSKSGKIGFHVDTNVPFLKVSGSSSGLKGGGEASVAGDAATIRNLRFEVDPKTFKTGIALRDQHMYEQVFTAADGSIPAIIVRADRFEASRNPKSSKWEAAFQAQVTMRKVTKPVRFHASSTAVSSANRDFMRNPLPYRRPSLGPMRSFLARRAGVRETTTQEAQWPSPRKPSRN